MRVKVSDVGEGLHPGEMVVQVATKDGVEQLAVDRSSVQGDTLKIGWPVGQSAGYYLVELPRETFTGFWRVWVPESSVSREPEETRAYA